jgi:hypothetical protein
MRVSALVVLMLCPLAMNAAEPARVDPKYLFRTDFANAHLPWYVIKPGEFPPLHSEHRVGGELVEADFIHRAGQFRRSDTGELVDFTLPAFGSVSYLNAEADLRDVPLGTYMVFFLYQDEKGAFTKAASIQDEYTMLASQGFTYRLNEAKLAEGKIFVTTAGPDRIQLAVNDKTRVWKGDKQVKLTDLAVGDDLLVNLTANTATSRGRCTDIWVGAENHKLATERQRKKHTAFLKERGLPAWIDRVEGRKLTVTLLSGHKTDLQALFKEDHIVPAQWAVEHRRVEAVVANEELRSYNPPVDRQGSRVLEFQTVPAECHGCGGVRWVIEPELLLEGFRKGRIIRLFVHPGWPIKDMPFGEGLYDEGFVAEKIERNPNYYAYRTDFLNKHLAWYVIKPGEFPPHYSEHRVVGELVHIDALHRSGRFRMDRTEEVVDFTLLPFASVMYLNAEAELLDVPLGMRCRFSLYQDAKGAFTRAAVVTDEFTDLASNKRTYRLDAAKLDEGKLLVAWQIPPVENEKAELVKPPDLGRCELLVDEKTRVWKGDKQVKLSDLAVGDELLGNLTGRTATSQGRCTDIYLGVQTHKLAAERQRKKHNAVLKKNGLPAWIDRVDGNKLTVTLFSGDRAGYKAVFNDEGVQPNELASRHRIIMAALADNELHLSTPPEKGMKARMLEIQKAATDCHGCSGERWIIESQGTIEGCRQGRCIRIFLDGWPLKENP